MPEILAPELRTYEVMRALLALGKTEAQVAALFGVADGTISKWLTKGRIPTGKTGRPRGSRNEAPKGERARKAVRLMIVDGKNVPSVARLLGMTIPAVRKLRIRWVDPGTYTPSDDS